MPRYKGRRRCNFGSEFHVDAGLELLGGQRWVSVLQRLLGAGAGTGTGATGATGATVAFAFAAVTKQPTATCVLVGPKRDHRHAAGAAGITAFAAVAVGWCWQESGAFALCRWGRRCHCRCGCQGKRR